MRITSKMIKFVVLSILGFFFLLIAIFLFSIFYESKENISNEQPYAQYLNKPIVIKSIVSMRWDKNLLRLSNYSLKISDGEDYDYGDVKTVKHYQVGDTVLFYKAMKYKNMHVGESYYLIGRDTLNDNTPIEFQYYFQDKHSNNIWETKAEFLERLKRK